MLSDPWPLWTPGTEEQGAQRGQILAAVCKQAAGERREPIAALRCTEQQHQAPAQTVADVNAAQRSEPKINWCKKHHPEDPGKYAWAVVMLLSRSRGKMKGIPGARCWCHVWDPSQTAAGYQLPACVLSGTVPTDTDGASRLPGRRRGKSTSSPNEGPEGSQPPPWHPALPSAYSRLAISISPGRFTNGLIKCLIEC